MTGVQTCALPILQKNLEGNYNFCLAASEKEGLEKISKINFEAVITDGNLKKNSKFMGGVKIAKAAKESGAYVIGLSGDPCKFSRLSYPNSIDVNYEKPYDLKIILILLRDKPSQEEFNKIK